MAIALDAVITDKIGFATHQNAAPILRQLSVHNLGVDAVDNVTVTLRSDPAFLAEKVWRFDQIRPDTEIAVTDRDVRLSASVLAGLTEAVSATVILTAVDVDGHELASTHYPIELLAHNEWGGIGAMADLLPAFVMPNDPAVDRVLKAASDGLRRMGNGGGIRRQGQVRLDLGCQSSESEPGELSHRWQSPVRAEYYLTVLAGDSEAALTRTIISA